MKLAYSVPLNESIRIRPDSDGSAQWPVVVVGAGPAGLVTAITLARAGIRCLVLNSRTAPAEQPRATVISLRSMELFRSWGLADAIEAGGHDVEWLMRSSTTLADVARGRSIAVGYPTVAQSARLSPTKPACVPQDHLEAVLLEHLRSLPAATIAVGVAVEDVSQCAGEQGFVVRARFDRTRTTTIGARYLVGADGARSIVREQLGRMAFLTEQLQNSMSVLFHAPLWDVVAEHRFGIYVTDAPMPGTFLPAGRGDRWVYAFSDADGQTPTTTELLDRIRLAAGAPRLPIRYVATNTFSFAAGIAERFRMGDAFLVGDAAHRVTPRGGTGMNTAIADGFNLGWRLGWVLRGWAADSLLDGYETDRRPVAEHNVIRSLDPLGSRRNASSELVVDLGGRINHHWVGSAQGRVSSLDLIGTGLTLLTTAPFAKVRKTIDSVPPVVVRHLRSDDAAALGADVPGGLLLRPDGVVWHPEQLSSATARMLQPVG